ncbi:MAG: undecaprenyldiphospho-muramoylpentapeptide beta-N-acetylglucosaminyltransferase [Magnetococcales bacterium]|nr:undecaprenyldiphospho-muramoylpentapeptide beta-N-acetylglucosaminyltransferase [Magnetococcales bacterium]
MSPAGKKLLLAGGGTGGHLFPALAVADLWEAGGGETLFVGAEGGMECLLIPQHGKRLKTLRVGRLKGSGAVARMRTLLGIPGAILAARRVLRAFQPHAVLGMGGYASAPAVIAARLAGIPTLLHDQNAIPGLTNRRLGRFADRILTGFAQATRYFPPGRAVETGNPVREALVRDVPPLTPPAPGEPWQILVFGGSQGARIFTEVVPEALTRLQREGFFLKVRQQARPEDVEEVRAAYQAAGIEADIAPFFSEMTRAYREAHLVISRAGASSVAELAATGRPSLLVPYPFAADDHQTANAKPLTDAGGAWTQRQNNFNVSWLTTFLAERLREPRSLEEAGQRARALARPRAAADMMDEILQLLARQGNG